ncbi:hypothetical protein [Pseudoruegeria sp. HB172150]|uniref:hypothetical protein n=1 Tax=Pseudoruegeria sp. HB172150 TaxID=2721164 RepID=UPI001553EC90|nr:hypothetical protein [Pseudoruegeria sp. HB172150]
MSLEGCESTFDEVFGESGLESVLEEDALEIETAAKFAGAVEAATDAGANAKANAGVGVGAMRKRKISQSKVHLPVEARPNDSWEIQPKSVTEGATTLLEGTAIPGVRLCGVRRLHGGNRMVIAGEVQVAKSVIRVSAKGGNRLNRAMNEYQNKDAIVAQILKKAILREAASNVPGRPKSIVAISRSEVSEE